jgi:hypothetical protein
MFDLNTAETQRELIPADTVAVIQLDLKPGGVGDGGWLKDSKDGTSRGLDCEFTVVDGEHAKRKFWMRFTLDGKTEGHKDAREIYMRMLRAIWESARRINPNDKSEDARKAREVADAGALDGIRFIGRIGVEAPKNGYQAKNTLLEVITPDRKNWHPVEQVLKSAERPVERAASEPAQPITRPDWAK